MNYNLWGIRSILGIDLKFEIGNPKNCSIPDESLIITSNSWIGTYFFVIMSKFKIPVHVEVEIRSNCALSSNEIIHMVLENLKIKCPVFQNGDVSLEDLNEYVSRVSVCDLCDGKRVSFWQSQLCIHAFRMSDQGPESDFLDGEEELSAAEQCELPNCLLAGLWESIVVESVVKNRLLSYCSSSIQFSDARIDSNIISWNRMVLLHGPPGIYEYCETIADFK